MTHQAVTWPFNTELQLGVYCLIFDSIIAAMALHVLPALKCLTECWTFFTYDSPRSEDDSKVEIFMHMSDYNVVFEAHGVHPPK